jgi:hypothetical protein
VRIAATPRTFGALAVCVTAILALCVAGVAGAATGTAVACPGTSSTAFAQWGDTDQYTLAPYGDFEEANFATTSGWTLTGGAAVVSGNESFFVHGKTDSHSLSLPAGSTATTAPICVNVYDPTMRFFVTGGGAGSALTVSVVATLTNGTVVNLPLARLAGGSTWAPTPAIYFYANLLALRSANGQANVQFRFTSTGSAGFKIDDLYLDPRKGH